MRGFLSAFVLLLSFSSLAFGSEGKLFIYIVPAAQKLDWSTNTSIVTSFFKSQALALVNNGIHDAQRRAIGHVVAKIQCQRETRWTGLSVDSTKLFPTLMNHGVAGMFAEVPHGYMQSAGEIKRFLANNSHATMIQSFPVSKTDCEDMIRMDDHFRSHGPLYFAPLLDTYNSYQSNSKLGGSGSTYVVALMKMNRSNSVDLNRWKEEVRISGRKYKFYSVQKMYDTGKR